MSEKDYIAGERSMARRMLAEALSALGYKEADKSRWVLEREAAIAQLRMACEDHGDNEWSESLHLADIIEKHLVRHIPAPPNNQ